MKIFSDNSTAVAYINNFGGTKSMLCNFKARQIWEMVISKHIWITAVHLPGVDNVTADKESRIVRDETEWSLNSNFFHNIKKIGINLNIDLFASRLNFKIDKFASWKADPLAWAVDAFTLTRNNFMFYAFPPFSIIDSVSKYYGGQSRRSTDCAILANTELVPISCEGMFEASIFNETREGCFDTEQQTRNTSSHSQK